MIIDNLLLVLRPFQAVIRLLDQVGVYGRMADISANIRLDNANSNFIALFCLLCLVVHKMYILRSSALKTDFFDKSRRKM
ncbi:MAG: hypothetical protein U5L07_06225 [Desulfobacterales bacterium]|nr:hypothetical protein [Desulfobacterales bacterium]